MIELVCINNNVGNALSSHLLETLRSHYIQLKSFSEKFQFKSDIRTYSEGELTKEIKFVGFTKQTYVEASSKNKLYIQKKPVVLIQDQVRQTSESDLILIVPENLTLCHSKNGIIDSAACLAASKRITTLSENLVS